MLNLNSLEVAVPEILHGMLNSKTGHLILTTPLSGKTFHRYEAMNGGAKCRKWGG